MEKTRIILVKSDYDYDTLMFEEHHIVTDELWSKIKKGDTIEVNCDGEILQLNVTALEFDVIDPEFIRFVRNNLMDEDQSKHTNFYVVGQ